VVGDLRQGVETIDRRKHFTALTSQQRFRRAPDGLAVVDDQHLEAG
jgi:hypothetical protein